jgi:TolB-like protein
VIPFGSTGDSALTRLGRDLVVTLSTNLDGVGSLRAVDPMSVIQRANQLPQPVPLAEARSLGEALGARSVLHGSLVREGALVRVNIGLYPVADGEPLARISFAATPDSVRIFTDSVSAELLRQVWRRGTPPSPLLSDVATASGDALRSFLAGEAAFGNGEMIAALEAYGRAVAIDSMFAQAWLRLDYSRQLILLPPDPVARAKVRTLAARLPARDRELLELRLTTGITTRQRVDSGRVLAARYPDYHTAQYQVGDNIIHGGPLVGIPMTEALPFIERLEVLAPRHADNALHRAMVSGVLGDTAAMRQAALDMIDRAPGVLGGQGRAMLRGLDARATGRRLPMDSLLDGIRTQVAAMAENPGFGWFAGGFWAIGGTPAESEALLAEARRRGILAAHESQLRFSEGMLDVARGRVAAGVERIATLETVTTAPTPVRLSAARIAAQAAWFGLLPADDAQRIVSRTRSRVSDVRGLDAVELTWSEAIVAIAAGDSVAFSRAVAAVPDTIALNASIARNLRALWRERRTGLTDSLIAAEEHAMETSTVFSVAMPLTRAAIGRDLVRRGEAARAEHYLQWPDALATATRSVINLSAMGSYSSYDRGLAREAAGDRAGAILHLQRFVEAVDDPPPPMRQQVDDAKARLERLKRGDR